MSKMTDKESTKQKIKAIYPHIVVTGTIDKPCYNIHWYDIEQKTMICGFGSYKLEFVRKWLEEEFEVVERDIDNLIARQQAEIERLKKENDEIFDNYTQAVFLQTKRTTEAIKKLVDVLKTKKLYSIERHEYIVPVAVIDWTEKEMVGEGK